MQWITYFAGPAPYNAPYATTGRKSFQPPRSGMAARLPRLSASEQSFYRSAIYKSLPELLRKAAAAFRSSGKERRLVMAFILFRLHYILVTTPFWGSNGASLMRARRWSCPLRRCPALSIDPEVVGKSPALEPDFVARARLNSGTLRPEPESK